MALFEASKLAKLAGSALSAAGYRNQASGFDPRSGDGALRFGGRFNPPHSIPVIYLCTSRPCVVAQLTSQADRQGLAVDDLLAVMPDNLAGAGLLAELIQEWTTASDLP